MVTILITGGAGNVASALAKKLAENKDNLIVILDNLSTGSLSKVDNFNGSADYVFLKGIDAKKHIEYYM